MDFPQGHLGVHQGTGSKRGGGGAYVYLLCESWHLLIWKAENI